MANTALDEDSDFEDGAAALNDDLDTESLIDEQSPADGYFEQRNIPQQTFIQNPALKNSKAEEAEEQSQPRPQPQPPSQPSQGSRWADEATPLLDVDAPPDYGAATAGQRQQQQQIFTSEHPLVRNGLLSDRSSVHSNTRSEPQSMRDSEPAQPSMTQITQPGTNTTAERDYATVEAQPTERTHLLRNSTEDRKAPARKQFRSSRSGKICLLALFVVLLVIFATIMTIASQSDGLWNGRDPDEDDPTTPIGPTPPHPSGRPNNCPFNSYSPTKSFEFTPSNGDFEFMERMDYKKYPELLEHGVRISGNVQISPADTDQENGGPDIKVWVNIATSAPLTIPNLLYDQDGSFLEILFPDVNFDGWRADRRACFDVAVAIHVRKGVRLNVWKTTATYLNINIDKHLFADNDRDGLVVKHDSVVSTVAGHISAKYWNSRRTIIETTSGRIEGLFALCDELTIRSTSGTILVDIDPRPADENSPLPAKFSMKTMSGSLSAVFPTSGDIPDRDYRTKVDSASGTLQGSYILGKETKFTTNSAKIDIAVLPYATFPCPLFLTTDAGSGHTFVDVLQPLHAYDFTESKEKKHRKGIIDSLHSSHHSFSGAIDVKYPQNWEGRFHAKSTTGSLDFHGKDVKFERKCNWVGCVEAEGSKGDAELSDIELWTVTGAIDATLGDVTRESEKKDDKDCWFRWPWGPETAPLGWWDGKEMFC